MGMSNYGVPKAGQTKYLWPLLSLFQIRSPSPVPDPGHFSAQRAT
jgi:hypothetical protein